MEDNNYTDLNIEGSLKVPYQHVSPRESSHQFGLSNIKATSSELFGLGLWSYIFLQISLFFSPVETRKAVRSERIAQW